jgi:hypothetical protein
MVLSRPTIFISLMVAIFSLIGLLTLAVVSAYSSPSASPPNADTEAPLNVGLDNQKKQGDLGASLFADNAASPTAFLDPAGNSVLGGVLCLGQGKGSGASGNTTDECGTDTGFQELNPIKNVAHPSEDNDAATCGYVAQALGLGTLNDCP